VNGEAEHVDFIDSSVAEEEEEIRIDPPTPTLTAPPLVQSSAPSSAYLLLLHILFVNMFEQRRSDCVSDFQEQMQTSSSSQTQDSTTCR